MTTSCVPSGFVHMPGEEFQLPGVATPPGASFSHYPVWTVTVDAVAEPPTTASFQYWLSVKDGQMWVSRLTDAYGAWDAPEEWAFWIDRQGAVVSEVFFVDGRVVETLIAHWDEIEQRINELEAIGKVTA